MSTYCGITVRLPGETGETHLFYPQRDITAYELAFIVSALYYSPEDITQWWESAGPDIWRHFQLKKQEEDNPDFEKGGAGWNCPT